MTVDELDEYLGSRRLGEQLNLLEPLTQGGQSVHPG